MAGLRLLLGPEDPISTLSAHTTLILPRLPPVDTVDAVMKTRNGAPGVFSASYGSQFDDHGFEVACENGVVALSKSGVTVNGEETEINDKGNGVAAELASWIESILNGQALDPRQSPEEALADMEVLELLLKSGEKGGEKVKLQLQ